MNARILVGYTATDSGSDALAVGARLARAASAAIDIVMVVPGGERGLDRPPAASYDRHVRSQAESWLGQASERIADLAPVTHVVAAESFATGLRRAAKHLGSTHIVVGAANGGLRGKHRLGAVATELLHSADRPVVLAPEGSRDVPISTGVTRLTTAVGTRPGADALVDETIELAAATRARVRLLSLITVDLPAGVDTGAIRIASAEHTEAPFARVIAALPADMRPETVTGSGDSVEAAVAGLDWEPGEFALVASSRLARRRRLFLGSTAARMLHELPVPMIVVPRERAKKKGAQS